ncbi:MAG TPA: glycosyltransferase [Pyrinomonadaceae bacterium]|nr:glycosyltransferase [Pyrinomonadaceae bacterium]
MSNEPKVSVFIPSYNHAQFLPAAIESVLAQTYPNVELVIVDDGSSDNSFEIASSYAAKYPTIVRVFTHPNRANLGISMTVNEGFKKSTGEFFSGLPSDDVLMPDKLEKQVRYLQSHPDVGWIYGKVQCVDDKENPLPETFGHDVSNDPRPVERLIIDNAVPGMSVLARRECFERVGDHTPDLLYSDWEFWIRMASQFKMAFMDRKLVKFRFHGHNTSVGVARDKALTRGLEVLSSLRRNQHVFAGELTAPRTQALIECQRYRYLFFLGRLEESSRSLLSVFEIYPALQDEPEVFEAWLRATSLNAAMPEYYRWTLEQLPTDLKTDFRLKITKRLKGLALSAQALSSYKLGDLQKTRRLAFQSIREDPVRLSDRALMTVLIETLVGSPLMRMARQLKQQMVGKQNGI